MPAAIGKTEPDKPGTGRFDRNSRLPCGGRGVKRQQPSGARHRGLESPRLQAEVLRHLGWGAGSGGCTELQRLADESKAGRSIRQSRLRFEDGKMYLLRVVVAEDEQPPAIITAYRTTKIEKYWSVE